MQIRIKDQAIPAQSPVLGTVVDVGGMPEMSFLLDTEATDNDDRDNNDDSNLVTYGKCLKVITEHDRWLI